ncbi:MAG: Organic solvent tolerance protein OstA [Cyclobacteriaceae bacterium]|nr:Organic solvent tolerance protein OstA [Cyclobacteriaceae bacterium]
MKNYIKITIVSIILFLFGTNYLFAQMTVKLEKADALSGTVNKEGERLDKAIGNVMFLQGETKIYCDSAYFFKKANKMDVFGNVRIHEGDSIRITSRRGSYDGNTKTAILQNNVVFRKTGEVTLYTNNLVYNRSIGVAKYVNGGKLVDSTNVLKSEKGYYHVNSRMASFKNKVVGDSPDFHLESDTLQYHTQRNVIYFRDTTLLSDKEGNLFKYHTGEYNTGTKKSRLNSGFIETRQYTLRAENLFLDNLTRKYNASGKVEMLAKNENIIISGEKAYLDKQKGETKVYGNALMKKVMDSGDTLYLSADTLVSLDGENEAEDRLLAYFNVKIFKEDLQGRADSLSYNSGDSVIIFYKDPVLWTQGTQLTADTVAIEIANNTIDKLNLYNNSFIISEDSMQHFNQIKGRLMETYFREGIIRKVYVNGNGESIYYVLNEEKGTVEGINNISCSNMLIRFVENQVNNISFYMNPDGSFIPPHEIKPENKELKGFIWREDEKPTFEIVTGNVPLPEIINNQ